MFEIFRPHKEKGQVDEVLASQAKGHEEAINSLQDELDKAVERGEIKVDDPEKAEEKEGE